MYTFDKRPYQWRRHECWAVHRTLIGKVGTDKVDGKCSWLVVQALKYASKEQRQVLEDNYGSKDDAAVVKVKKVYDELKLQEKYSAFEEISKTEITTLIDESAKTFEYLKPQLFHRFFWLS